MRPHLDTFLFLPARPPRAPAEANDSGSRAQIAAAARVAVASHSFPKSSILRQELLARYPASTFNETGRPLGRDALIDLLRGHDKAITGLETLDEAVFEAAPHLRVVSKYGVGLDTIDVDAARRHGVAVRWTPGVNRQAVAELTIGLMLALCRHIVASAWDVRAGQWRRVEGRQLSSAIVGILGCGHVGQQVARLCRAFGAKVFAHDIRVYRDFYHEHGVEAVTFKTLLEESDIVTVHLPLDASTRGMIGATELSSVKRGALLINTARGGIIDEDAVTSALRERHLGGAAFDVFAVEPPLNRQLLDAPNFIGTPHAGAATHEAVLAMGRAAIAGLDGGPESVDVTAERVPNN
jgi:phosphoglycerate dehydrogenase-like enzyme